MGLFIELVPNVLYQRFLIRWFYNFKDLLLLNFDWLVH